MTWRRIGIWILIAALFLPMIAHAGAEEALLDALNADSPAEAMPGQYEDEPGADAPPEDDPPEDDSPEDDPAEIAVSENVEDAAEEITLELNADGAEVSNADGPVAQIHEYTIDPAGKAPTYTVSAEDTLRLRVKSATMTGWTAGKKNIVSIGAIQSDDAGQYVDIKALQAIKKLKLTVALTGHKKKKATVNVVINDPFMPASISFKPEMPASLPVGGTLRLADMVRVLPEYAHTDLIFKASGAAKADKAGLLTATKAGKATITVTAAKDKKVKATFKLTVLANQLQKLTGKPAAANYAAIQGGWTLWPIAIQVGKKQTLDCQFNLLNATGEKSTLIDNLTLSVAAGTRSNIIARKSFPSVKAAVASNKAKTLKLSLPITGSMADVFLPDLYRAGRLYIDINADTVALKSKGGSYGFIPTLFPIPMKYVSGISLSQTAQTLAVGQTLTLTAQTAPADADDPAILWTTSSPAVATVADGLVTAVGAGTAVITATAADGGGATATCAITVRPSEDPTPGPDPQPGPQPGPEGQIPVTGVALHRETASLAPGQTLELTADIQPENATNPALTWQSDRTDVATVDEAGVVTAVGPGVATITATAADGSGKSARCVVTVDADLVHQAGAFTVSGGLPDVDYSYAGGVLIIYSTNPLTIKNTSAGSATTDCIYVTEGIDADITLNGVNISAPYGRWEDVGSTLFNIKAEGGAAFTIAENSSANVTVRLAAGSTNTLSSGVGRAGLEKSGDRGTLTITGRGALKAYGCHGGAGIGGKVSKNGTGIIIQGGDILADANGATAVGGTGAGIGGGDSGRGSDIAIQGGKVAAVGGAELRTYNMQLVAYGAAGIGGGFDAAGSDIEISDGTVTAQGGWHSAGIGGGHPLLGIGGNQYVGNGSDITISGGHVKATGGEGGNAGYGGAGIGGAQGSIGEAITISGGTVEAIGLDGAAGIGGGVAGAAQGITISGGSVTAKGGTSLDVGSGAGIGSGAELASGSNFVSNIQILGGEVTASGGSWAAGIGGANNTDVTDILIADGKVTATGGGAGIGGGGGYAGLVEGSLKGLTIRGGTIVATGGPGCAGIGGHDCDDVVITGGDITAEGGKDGGNGFGIGGAGSSEIRIDGGTVRADSGARGGAGIGGARLKLTITGGDVRAIGRYESFYGNGTGSGVGIGGGEEAEIVIKGGAVRAEGENQAPGLGYPKNNAIQITGGVVTGIGSATGGIVGNSVSIKDAFVTATCSAGAGICCDSLNVDIQGDSLVFANGNGRNHAAIGQTERFIDHDFRPGAEADPIAWHGIVFRNKRGRVYGVRTAVGWNATIPAGMSLDINSTQTVRVDEGCTLTNDGTIRLYGALEGDVAGSGAVIRTGLPSETGPFAVEGGVFRTDYDYYDGALTLITDAPLTLHTTQRTDDIIQVYKNVSARVTLAGVEASQFVIPDNARGHVRVTLAAGSANELSAGLVKNAADADCGQLTIDGTGALLARGAENCAGIGSGRGLCCANITIEGGYITAYGGTKAAGIGSGSEGSCVNLTIKGGTVFAYGAGGGAGIGGGNSNYGGARNIAISGGNILAKGSDASMNGSAAIGGGSFGYARDIKITGGVIEVYSGAGGAGIGGGRGGGDIGNNGYNAYDISASNCVVRGEAVPYYDEPGELIGPALRGTSASVTIAPTCQINPAGGPTGVIPITGLSLNQTVAALAVGGTLTLRATVAPANATEIVVWRSDAEGVARVANGVVTAIGAGVAKISALNASGTLSATCTVTVTLEEVKATGLALDRNTATLAPTQTLTLTPVFQPENATNRQVSWSTDAPGVATVDDNGVVTALAAGTATITATAADGGFTASCAVTVDPNAEIAVGDFAVKGGVTGVDYKYENGVFTVLSATPITIRNASDGATGNSIAVAADVNADITLDGVNIESSKAAFEIADNSAGQVTVRLAEDSLNALVSGSDCAGLQKDGVNGTLTITGSGALTATGGEYGAGIGGGINGSASNITISGGSVTATAGEFFGAGIGGGSNASASDITISGGTVIAAGGHGGGAGIGGGGSLDESYKGGDATNITISGGTVTATSFSGAGIGAGHLKAGATGITISGGVVKVESDWIGIGGYHGRDIVIKDSDVTAEILGTDDNIMQFAVGGNITNITIDDSTVRAYGGIRSIGGENADIAITGGTIYVSGRSSGRSDYLRSGAGIGSYDDHSYSSVKINGSSVYAATSGSSYGIYTCGSTSITDSYIEISGSGGWGINTDASLVIRDGTMVIVGGTTEIVDSYVNCPQHSIDSAVKIKGSSFVVASNAMESNESTAFNRAWHGIVFLNGEGRTFGDDNEIIWDVEIPESMTLQISSPHTVTVAEGHTLTNNGVIHRYGALSGSVQGSGTIVTGDSLPSEIDHFIVDTAGTIRHDYDVWDNDMIVYTDTPITLRSSTAGPGAGSITLDEDCAAQVTLDGIDFGGFLIQSEQATPKAHLTLAAGSRNVGYVIESDDYSSKNCREFIIGGSGRLELRSTDRGIKYPMNLTINGGTIDVTKSGIDCRENLTINGGTVDAYNNSGAGIRCLKGLKITGGVIKAIGSQGGAGIGGSYDEDVLNYTISGGVIFATGSTKGNDSQGSAAIGGGFLANASNIAITGGQFVLTSYGGGAGIGGGRGGGPTSGYDVPIRSGVYSASNISAKNCTVWADCSGSYDECGEVIGRSFAGAGIDISIDASCRINPDDNPPAAP